MVFSLGKEKGPISRTSFRVPVLANRLIGKYTLRRRFGAGTLGVESIRAALPKHKRASLGLQCLMMFENECKQLIFVIYGTGLRRSLGKHCHAVE